MGPRGRRRVGVLGAGIMGSAVALGVARRGHDVLLVDGAEAPMARASRWNEGKIHLGYLYAADGGLATAKRLLPGGLAFRALTEELIGQRLDAAVTPHDDVYLVHRDSVIDIAQTGRYFAELTQLVAGHPDADSYLVDVSRSTAQVLTGSELGGLADGRLIQGGFRVPERSVSTEWVADRLVAALRAQERVELVMDTHVSGIERRRSRSGRPAWRVCTAPAIGSAGDVDVVVNALWEGRIAIDAAAGLQPEPGWSHRYRLSVFLTLAQPTTLPSAVVATGPFGDVKNYNGRDLYASWYPAGLQAEGHALEPPAIPPANAAAVSRIADETIAGLSELLPAFGSAVAGAARRVRGGWVFAMGRGSLADVNATLHRRDRFGIHERDGYFSVDTGKYSTAPWLAARLTDMIAGS